ncbi:hypothetical protein GDO81_025543 [Engystomops pustulosus]|uniref:Uncharacterized protein n=1 Tax=Engystomops pustulosus TaxID=76066 RepID=A0AAV6YHB6_ENGPU|nr:hypothetical protein GDO81_025543 [Engystomops pustulosus]
MMNKGWMKVTTVHVGQRPLCRPLVVIICLLFIVLRRLLPNSRSFSLIGGGALSVTARHIGLNGHMVMVSTKFEKMWTRISSVYNK